MPTLTVRWETTTAHKEDAMPRYPTIFEALCQINDAFYDVAVHLKPGPEQQRLHALVKRLDEVIDRTIGMKEVEQRAEEGGTAPCA
jgi:hypothetical protein